MTTPAQPSQAAQQAQFQTMLQSYQQQIVNQAARIAEQDGIIAGMNVTMSELQEALGAKTKSLTEKVAARATKKPAKAGADAQA